MNHDTMEDDKLKNVRQPIVIAMGILPGFTLNIAAIWIPNAFSSPRYLEY